MSEPISRENYDMLWQDYQTLRQEHAELRQQREKPKQKASLLGRLFSAIFWLSMLALMVFATLKLAPEILITYGGVPIETVCKYLSCPGAQPATATPVARPTATLPPLGGGYTGGQPTRPDCSTVRDTTTPCDGTPGEMPAGVEQEEHPPPPTGTPEPRWVTETCLTPPGGRPCWLAEGEPWTPPQEVPLTPIVLLPEPTSVPLVFVEAACAAWHPPQPWPEECGEE